MFYGAYHLPELTSRIGPHVHKCDALDVIHGPGGQYWKKLCRPKPLVVLKIEGSFFQYGPTKAGEKHFL